MRKMVDLERLKEQFPAFAELLSDCCSKELYKSKGHPLKWLLQIKGPTLRNMEMSLRVVQGKFPDWFNRKREQLCVEEYANVCAALAEIRAFGYLLSAGFNVEPREMPGHDFDIEIAGKRIAIEVSAVLMHGKEAEKLERFRNRRGFAGEVIYPAGEPREGELSVDNVAHKFSQKAEEENAQLPKNYPSILWLDLQFEDWWALSSDEAWPLYVIRGGRFRTGGIWLAFYGRKGTALIDGESLTEGLPRSARGVKYGHMRYPGYFYKKDTRASGAVITWPQCTVLFDNPWAPRSLPGDVIKSLLTLRWFDWPHSWIRPFWYAKSRQMLREKTKKMLNEINHLAKNLLLDW